MAGSEAQAGFYYQNLVAALHLLELIDIGSNIRSITLENPDRAPHIDDIIIDTDTGSRFIQIKWTKEQETSFTLANLVAEEEGGSLWLKLARGYQQISSEHGEKIVELLSTRREGIKKQPGQGFERSLKQFITEFHTPYILSPPGTKIDAIHSYSDYKQIIQKLKGASGITDGEVFAAFLKSMRFTLGQDDIDTVAHRVKARLHQLGIEQQQFGTLLDRCVNWSIGSRQITASLVLEALGLEDRFAERLNHRYPVDDALWVPTPNLFQALDNALDSLSSGFIAVIGEPGAGKSTALTKYLNANSSIKFGYYCFIPNEKVIGNDRLQEEAFVRSVCLGLKDAFPDFKFSKPYSTASVQLLNIWLKELSESSQRVVFLVDGIDHVDRKTRQSLLSKPLTSVLDGHLPDNVLIILSTRYEQALPPAIISHLKQQPTRRIEVKRFERWQISKFMALRGVEHNDSLLDQIVTISAGVPIYLEYLAKKLFDMTATEQDRYLQQTPTLRGEKIDHYHDHMWQEWTSDLDTKYLLAILAVREEYTTAELLQILLASVNRPLALGEIKHKLQAIRYVLKESEAKGFTINHASLTEFVSERTSELRPEITRAILDWYGSEPTTDESWRNRFRHLLELGLYEEALQACDNDWVNRAWQFYRPLPEIQKNLDLVWKASIQAQDLHSFIRIGLLKQQAGLIEQNIDLEPIDIATTLLDVGLSDAALNTVWDGERSLISPSDFAIFAAHYESRLGRLLPASVVREALSNRQRNSYQATAKIYRIVSLVVEPAELLKEISQLRWQTTTETSHLIDAADDTENSKLNLNLQLEVIKSLAEHCLIDKLIALASLKLSDSILHVAIEAALTVAFAKAKSVTDAISTSQNLQLDCLPKGFLFWIQVQLARHRIPFAMVETISIPAAPKKLDKNYEFNMALVKAFSEYRGFLLNRTDGTTLLRSRCVGLTGPVADINHALISLAELWVQSVGNPPSANNLERLKSLCNQLSISVDSFATTNDYHSYLYYDHAHELYQHLWDYAVEFLDHKSQIALAIYWLGAEDGCMCERFSIATRNLVRSLAKNSADGINETKRKLLEVVETVARKDEETMVLTSSFIESAKAWGICGFRDEAVRLWSEISKIACGVGYRKDYQFSEIFLPLEIAHNQDPSGSLRRLNEQLELAHHLEDTGAGKQVAIAIEGLLELVAQWKPALVFRGLVEEESLIFRERALRGVLLKLVTNKSLDKQLLLAILKTMSRWENHNHFNDETAPAMKEFFAALLEQKEYQIADETYQFARQVFLVEKQLPHLLSDLAIMRNANHSDNELAKQDEETFREDEKQAECQEIEDVFDDSRDSIKSVLEKLAPDNISEVTRCLEDLALEERKKKIARKLTQERNDWLQALLNVTSLNSIPSEFEQYIDNFLESFEQRIVELLSADEVHSRRAVEELVHDTVHEFALLIGVKKETIAPIEEGFDLDTWLDSLFRPSSLGYSIERQLEDRLPEWIQDTSFNQLSDWLSFARKNLTSDARALALVEVAKRYKFANPSLAFELLEEATDCIATIFFEHGKLKNDICNLALSLDTDKACHLILNSFRQQYNKYPVSLIYRLGSLVKTMSTAMAIDGVVLYETWALHNRRLTDGLTSKPLGSCWITADEELRFEEEAISYLLALLRYPEIDVRLLSVEALVELLSKRADLIESLQRHWPTLSCGQREYVASMLDSLGRLRPDLVELWASWLQEEATKEEHYNLSTTVALALSRDELRNRPEHPLASKAWALLDRPSIVLPLKPQIVGDELPRVRLTPYQNWVLNLLSEGCDDPRLLHSEALRILDDIYNNAQQGLEQEYSVHREHNINTNFDNLEIAASFDEACRSSVNKAIIRLIAAHEIDPEYLTGDADILRHRDPTDSLVKSFSRPTRVDWLSRTDDDSGFINFIDINASVEAALRVEDGFIRLFEYTEQRSGGEIGSQSQRACIVQSELFGIQAGAKIPEDMLDYLFEHSRIRDRNAYRFELPWRESPRSQLSMPLVSSSSRNFRGRRTCEIAALSGIWKDCFPDAESTLDYLGAQLGESIFSRATEWQEEFDQGRRRHEPKSTGFLLEVDVNLLRQLASELNLDVFARIKLSRTIDKYKPEYDMDWHDKICLVKVF
ncbi:ATP-binding protein [Photobacterium sp. GSS17]|uniref:ATP-binding protein n=1 Tax=Photobacterium sp. GSS17 TaxID=3020715 RepID=UPI00235DF986|nr:ATP-binding protein [Photobacterium sp. GSS17]